MKVNLKLFRGEIFATAFIFGPFLSEGMCFQLEDKQYKVLQVMHMAEVANSDAYPVPKDEQLPILTVVEIPVI